MITKISDLAADERSILACEARNEADQIDRYWEPTPAAPSSPRAVRWREIAEAFESGGKEPHGVEPGVYTELPIADAGTGGLE